MRAPEFWQDGDSLAGRLLDPLGRLYTGATALRLARATPWRAPIPVACVGNLTAGGAGKTPIVRDLAARLALAGRRPAILSRGYGGRERGPLAVDPARHDAASVGDEPLLMARDAPCWIAADRARGGQAIAASGAGMIVMDDGLQNTGLWQDFRLVVVDGATGFGNGRGIPAGPLREQIGPGLSRANAVVLIGDDARGILPALSANASVYRADLALLGPISYAAQRLVAFAGIGRPEKFRDSLTRSGAVIAGFQAFPDHHAYTIGELAALADQARRADALLVTTEKDWVRLDADWRGRIAPVPVRIVWRDEVALSALLDRLPARG